MFGQVTHAFPVPGTRSAAASRSLLSGHIDYGTTVTAAAKLQELRSLRPVIFHQGNATTVTGQLRVDLGLQQILYALHQRGIVRYLRILAFGAFSVSCEPSWSVTKSISASSRYARAQLINICRELVKFKGSVSCFHRVWRTIETPHSAFGVLD